MKDFKLAGAGYYNPEECNLSEFQKIIDQSLTLASVPNAVAVANIVTENMLKGNSKIQEIKLDSVISEEDGQMISNIEIVLLKN